MKLHRFIGPFDLSQPSITITDPELIHQIQHVLHLAIGEHLLLGDGQGHEAEARIVIFSSRGVETELIRTVTSMAEPGAHVILYCAVLKRENFDWVVQKATEVGVKEIVPLITERTIKLQFKRPRLAKVIREAAEQSGRGVVPVLHDPIKFNAVLPHASHNDVNYFLDAFGEPWEMKKETAKGTLGIFVGPEGGWSPDESAKAKESDFFITTLGRLIFRAETAAIVASYLATQA